jgi:CHAT domain-containing protein
LSGLGRAFLFAGATTLVVSQWNVADETAKEIITELFSRLTGPDRPTIARALRDSMSRVRSTAERGNPYYWAPFVIVGDGQLRYP